MPHRTRTGGTRLVYCPAPPVRERQLLVVLLCTVARPTGQSRFRVWLQYQGVLEWNVVSSGLVTAGGQIVLALGLAAETIFRSHEPRWRGKVRAESDSADQSS